MVARYASYFMYCVILKNIKQQKIKKINAAEIVW